MGQKDKEAGRMELSRRDFLKVTAAGAAAAAALDFAPAPAMAEMPLHTVAGGYSGTDTAINRFHTTCPYCSASCGQIIAVGNVTEDVYDVYGDVDSPINNGGLCAKGAGAYQLVTNKRRLGAFAGTHPVNPKFAYDGTYTDGVAYRRVGNADWDKVSLASAMDAIATKLVADRDSTTPVVAGLGAASNSKHVQFFGCSHMNNEQNYLYRKIIADFGTSLTEHQARI
jgi:formate dehydrogenase major subunit